MILYFRIPLISGNMFEFNSDSGLDYIQKLADETDSAIHDNSLQLYINRKRIYEKNRHRSLIFLIYNILALPPEY